MVTKAFLHFHSFCTCFSFLFFHVFDTHTSSLCFHNKNTFVVASEAILELCVLSIQRFKGPIYINLYLCESKFIYIGHGVMCFVGVLK